MPLLKTKKFFDLRSVLIYSSPLCICFFLSLSSYSQSLTFSSSSALAQKVYLQTDNKIYATGSTVWFKAVVTGAADHITGRASGVLYTELIDPYENIVERKLIKLDKGIGDGFFGLAPGYAHGYYQLRAYTEWNKNFGEDFFFKDYLLVSGAEGTVENNLIERITVLEKEGSSERRLSVDLSPGAADSIGGKGITVTVRVDDKTDTLSVKKNKVNRYGLDYTLSASAQLVTLKVETDNNLKQSRTIALDTTLLDVQFTPESGELVQGLPSVVGIKALNYSGRGKAVEGEIFGRDGKIIASFTTNQLGMGWVRLQRVDSSEHYRARVKTGKVQTMVALPPVVSKGTILSVAKKVNEIELIALSNYLTSDSVTVKASCRGVIYYNFKGKLKEGILRFSFPSSSLPEGITSFTLMVKDAPVAERLFFNQREETRLSIGLSSGKNIYTQREQTKLTIDTKDSKGNTVPANLSLLVFNKTAGGTITDYRQNILSYFLLSSDLRGEVENPGYYFQKDIDHSQDLDALMLTQGWRKYNYGRATVVFRHSPEPTLAIAGSVKGGLSNKKIIQGAEMTLMSFGKEKSFAKTKTDSLGRFFFPLPEDYSGILPVLIQSADKAKAKDYLVTLDQKENPPILFNHQHSVETPDSIARAYIKKVIADKKTEDAFNGVTLEEVIVKTRILSPQQKKVTDKYGAATAVIEGDEIRKRDPKWSYGFYSALQANFPDKVRIIDPGAPSPPFAYVPNKIGPTLIVVDGIAAKVPFGSPISQYYLPGDYENIPFYPASEIKSFEIIENAKNFRSLWCEAYMNFPLRICSYAPVSGNVIAVYTYAGKGPGGVTSAAGMNNKRIPVFSPTREFYAPKYEQLKAEDWKKPDLRNLIHWQPQIKTDSSGKASLLFYNSDNMGTIQVIVEAISDKGEIGYSELLYEVKKKQ